MTQQTERAGTRPSRRRIGLIAVAVAAGLAAGVAGIYGIGGLQRNADPACRPAAALAQSLKPLARGDVAALNIPDNPIKIPNVSFKDAAGAQRSLADWKGRTVLLNLWATWCVPCRQEMPALDALQKQLGSASFEVVAVNIDTVNLTKPKAWLAEARIASLAYYADSNAKVFQDLKEAGRAFGMPTTLLIDINGCELGTINGPAEWAGDDAIKLIEAALKIKS